MITKTALIPYFIARISALSDNYIFVLYNNETNEAVVVDPAEAEPVLEFLEREHLDLKHIINTHHHYDHIGGNAGLKEAYKNCQVWAPEKNKSQIKTADHWLSGDETIELIGINLEVMAVPGHTLGHIAYYLPEAEALFCGDTLFSFGCGRLFEGTPATMWESLKKLRSLPDTTAVYCAHEYTRANLKFARSIDTENEALLRYQSQLPDGPTIPFTLKDQKELNPFLRAEEFCLKWALKSPEEAFAKIRSAKDNF